MNYDQQSAEGKLSVRATTAGGVLPVPGATVTVRSAEGEEDFLQVAYTDENGRTPVFLLHTPPAATSLSPGIPHPYATYTVRVESDGFFSYESRNVPVFAGVHSIQTADLIPRSPYGDGRPPAGATDFSTSQTLAGGE